MRKLPTKVRVIPDIRLLIEDLFVEGPADYDCTPGQVLVIRNWLVRNKPGLALGAVKVKENSVLLGYRLSVKAKK